MANPVLVEVTRGGRVESAHRGSAVVVDETGRTLFSAGDPQAPVFPRSAIKAMQALPLVETGAADAYRFGDVELALACASHSGEPAHVEGVASMLAAAGLMREALECGSHWPSNHAATVALARSGQDPTALHNNCSGKHAGFICTAKHLGIGHEGYVSYHHPVQKMLRQALTELTGAHLAIDNCGTDGCSIPTYAVPLQSIASGFVRMITGDGLEPIRARAARRIFDACMAKPFFVAGTHRTCTRLMETQPGAIFAKTGAEGVFCAALPRQAIAVAIKCDDGNKRAADAAVAALLARFIDADEEARERLWAQSRCSVRNWNNMDVGTVRVTETLM
ncbi:MAG: asparaginase [Pseudomonadota bacterium]